MVGRALKRQQTVAIQRYLRTACLPWPSLTLPHHHMTEVRYGLCGGDQGGVRRDGPGHRHRPQQQAAERLRYATRTTPASTLHMIISLWYSIHSTPFHHPCDCPYLLLTHPSVLCTGGLVDKITPAMQATYYAFMQERRSVDDIATNRTGGARERPCKVRLLQPAPPPPLDTTLSHIRSLFLTPFFPSLFWFASRGRSAPTWPVWRRPATRWTGSEQTCPPLSCPPSTQPSRPCKSKVNCASAPCRVDDHLLPETLPQPVVCSMSPRGGWPKPAEPHERGAAALPAGHGVG